MAVLLDLQLLRTWEERLEVGPTNVFRVRNSQVDCTEYRRRYRFIGYCRANNTFYYDKKIDEGTIVHELLHKKHPEWSETEVRKETKRLVAMIGGITGST